MRWLFHCGNFAPGERSCPDDEITGVQDFTASVRSGRVGGSGGAQSVMGWGAAAVRARATMSSAALASSRGRRLSFR